MKFKGPLADSWGAAAVMVVCALVPYLALSAAFTPLIPILSKSLGLSTQALQLTSGMANAAYAFGTVMAVQFAVHLRARRMLVLYAALFVFGSVMAATAITPGLFIAGHVLQGLTTSLMLIAAVPPLIIGWPTSKMRYTAIIMNLCIFGAVAAGPVIGGVQAGAKTWEPLFWIVTGIGGLALLFALLTFEDDPPQDKSAPWDFIAIGLAGLGSAAAFFGASELQTHSFMDLITFFPLVAGVLMIVALVIHQGLVKNPLMPVRQAGTTFPVAGILIAIAAGAAALSIIALVETAYKTRATPIHLAMLFWPELGGAVASAILFGALFRTRWVPALALGGMAAIAGGGAVLTGAATGGQALVVVGSGLLGIGVGASVSPALFIAGFSMRNTQLQRVFALVELLRGVAAFMVTPVILHFAMTISKQPAAGTSVAIWVCLGIAAAGGLLALYLMVLGRARLQKPDLDRWMDGDDPAWDSPPLLAGIRAERTAPEHASPRSAPAGVTR